MGLKVFINDKLVDESEAKISVFDHGLLYGDGVFEGIRVYNGKIFEFRAHMERLYASAHAIRLQIPQDIDELSKNVEMTVKANNIVDGYIRPVVTRGVGTLGINPLVCKKAQIIIIVATIQLYPQELYEKGLKVISANTMRIPPLSLSTQIKSLNYLNNILAKLEALDYGVMEAIMYNNQGFVAEAAADNLFVVRDGRLLTPPISAGALGGITRGVIMRLARESGYEVAEENLTRYDLYIAAEIFLTGTGAEMIGVVEVDGRQIGQGRPGPITCALRKKFEAYARG
ncbi:MAG: branched-chain amino acid aminotransferase [Phycisphaerae bacterium SM23_30]|nr:MAG: branched-chain amino acid aminotransferase [Phycisphaerae bacterium SM23_30]